MISKCTQKAVDSDKSANTHISQKQIVVQCKSIGWVDVAAAFEETSSPEARLLRDQIPARHQVIRMRRQDPVRPRPIVVSDRHPMAVDRVDVWVKPEIVGDEL